jgi:antirestriction protein ArdC
VRLADGFGSESYAKEELVAEMTSAFLSLKRYSA